MSFRCVSPFTTAVAPMLITPSKSAQVSTTRIEARRQQRVFWRNGVPIDFSQDVPCALSSLIVRPS